MKRSHRWNTLQVCLRWDSSSSGSDLVCNVLTVRPRRRQLVQWVEMRNETHIRFRERLPNRTSNMFGYRLQHRVRVRCVWWVFGVSLPVFLPYSPSEQLDLLLLYSLCLHQQQVDSCWLFSKYWTNLTSIDSSVIISSTLEACGIDINLRIFATLLSTLVL